MAPSPPTPTAPKTIADFFARPAKRLRAGAPAPASASLSSSSSSLSPEQRRRADTNLALARARHNLRLAESRAKGTPPRLRRRLPRSRVPVARTPPIWPAVLLIRFWLRGFI